MRRTHRRLESRQQGSRKCWEWPSDSTKAKKCPPKSCCSPRRSPEQRLKISATLPLLRHQKQKRWRCSAAQFRGRRKKGRSTYTACDRRSRKASFSTFFRTTHHTRPRTALRIRTPQRTTCVCPRVKLLKSSRALRNCTTQASPKK